MRNTELEMRTSNVERRTSNVEVKNLGLSLLRRSMFDVRCSMFVLIFLPMALLATGCNLNQPPSPPPPPPTQLIAARDALSNQQPDNAITAARAFLIEESTGPRAAEAMYLEGRGFEERTSNGPEDRRENLTEARSCYWQSLQQNPPKSLERDVYTSLSNTDFYLDHYADCIQESSAAMELSTDRDSKENLLYRIGVCQQRLGTFDSADQTFRQVEQRYPNTKFAQSAHQLEGSRQFFVQVATFAHPEQAAAAADALTKAGTIVSTRTNNDGDVILDAGPYPTFKQAKALRDSIIRDYPLAVIVP
jgi:tetratricopeptide (TPR) repeat protein